MSAADDQTIELTPEQLLVLRGALNVADELLARAEPDAYEQYPIEPGQRPVIDRLRQSLQNRIEQQAMADPSATVRATLDAAEAQAVRDVAGTLETLLQDPAGKELLVDVGFLSDVDDFVDPDDLSALLTVMDMLEPTGIRPEPDYRRRPRREGTAIVDPTLPPRSVIANAEDELANFELPWPGFEQATYALYDVADSYADRTTLSCEKIYTDLVVVTKLAIAGQRHFQGQPPSVVGGWPSVVEEAYLAVMGQIETKHCVPSNAQETLWDRVDEVLNSITSPQSTSSAMENAQALLATMADLVPALERESNERGAIQTDYRPSARDWGLERIITLRTELRDVADAATESGTLGGDYPNVENLDHAIHAILPAKASATCEDYAVALAELVEIDTQVVAATDVGGPFLGDPELLDVVEDARNFIFSRLRELGCFAERTRMKQAALITTFQNVHEPETNADRDVVHRAQAAIDEIRSFYVSL